MMEDEKNGAIREAVGTCLDKAEGILAANQESGTRGLFTIYVDEDGGTIISAGHTLALDSAYQKALRYIIEKLFQPLKPGERR